VGDRGSEASPEGAEEPTNPKDIVRLRRFRSF
jgi:hypothetical protein